AIEKARQALADVQTIPCTACHYCTEGCPMQIPIPQIFSARNLDLIWSSPERARGRYQYSIRERGKASDCIACGQCESACPQHIGIIEALKTCAELYE
ncbi:MAG: 4Fe-4S dicluster domain-containing protein, partial [Clostridia bacterium]|nr:4Fe-4S dicluster domain-containing protein [Clostridia bacterium]